jgi:adenylate cyclase
VSAAARDHRGHVVAVAGDGVMSVYGAKGSADDGVRDAFGAALSVWDGIDALNEELRGELGEPLRFGMGLHLGLAVVGIGWDGGTDGMPFLGDTGNVAARLEAEAKRSDCTLVASREAVSLLAEDDLRPAYSTVSIAGKQEPMSVAHFRQSVELRRLLRRHADI